jgi:hypothetical protein
VLSHPTNLLPAPSSTEGLVEAMEPAADSGVDRESEHNPPTYVSHFFDDESYFAQSLKSDRLCVWCVVLDLIVGGFYHG